MRSKFKKKTSTSLAIRIIPIRIAVRKSALVTIAVKKIIRKLWTVVKMPVGVPIAHRCTWSLAPVLLLIPASY